MKEKELLYGGDYNPEQWLNRPDILEEDIRLFLQAGINTVTVGIFSWAKLEPKEGEYRLEWLEQIIDRLWENGISVILATPSAARPHWLADRYPEVLRMNDRRERRLFGRRHNHCLTSPAYREKTAQIDRKLAERFKDHPAVRMWHISNEFNGDCHCPLCQEAFRGWLKNRYETIENLNDRWCTAFWSHTYDDFSQVESPSDLGENSIMALDLDWKRFVTDQTIDFMEGEIRALRQAGAAQPVTTNLMYDYPGLNYFKLAQKIDLVSWDNYPLWHKKPVKETAADSAFWHDLMRSMKDSPFLMMESSPASTNWQGVSKLKKPGDVAAASLQSIAHGADGALYFQMRQSRGAEEKFHGAVIDHYGGSDTRTFREVCGIGKALKALEEVKGAAVQAKAAVLYDWENRWALEGSKGPRNDGMHYREHVQKSYSALRRLGLDVDVIDQSCSLDKYRFVAAPMQYLFHDGFEGKLRRFVENGGTLVMTCWSGVVDENDRCFLGETPYGLTDVLGLRAEEIDGLYDWEENEICQPKNRFDGMKDRYGCRYLCELVKPFSAETLMVYGKDFYAGKPALLRNAFGKGQAFYVCADAKQDFFDDLYEKLTKEAGIERLLPDPVPDGVEVTGREKGSVRYLFFQNFSGQDVKLCLPAGKVLLGKENGELGPMETLVLRTGK